jgi:formate hydrogenlyase subunit 3/multisubunit Na+/H+ antiporter MnhD subunit
MTTVEGGLLAQGVLAVAACVAAVATPSGRRQVVAGVACAALGLAGAVTGGKSLAGGTGQIVVEWALPLGPLVLAPDRLGGFFMLLAGGVGVVVSVYAIGYVHGPAASRTGWAALALFLAGMQLVPAAGDVVGLLFAWETMALSSTVLVLSEHAIRPSVRSAALWYAVMTHLSLVLVLAGSSVLAVAAGSTRFDAIAGAVGPGSSAGIVAFGLLCLGGACKAGLFPLHVWLPRAHPEAPSHVSAAMSGAMVAMGVYVILLAALRLLPHAPGWWGVVLVALGANSALYGILQAAVTSDLKRLLAHSTTENLGLAVLAAGAGILLRSHGAAAAGDVALTACLLLLLSHAAFKTALFLAAGAVLQATGERDLDLLGGLATRMPWTATAFGLASAGAAALPVTSGFVAEWVLLQALIHGGSRQDRLVGVVMPLAVGAVALTTGLALLASVKAFGTAFLGRARSPGAATAHECSRAMRIAVAAAASAVGLLGLVPGPLAVTIAGAIGAHGINAVGLLGIELPGLHALLDPLALAVAAAASTGGVAVVTLLGARRGRRRERVALAWGCGGVRVSPRMQYTATSYAEPLLRVFDDALRPVRDVEITATDTTDLFVEGVRYRQQLGDIVELAVYRPVLAAVERLGEHARRIQNGSIHRYLTFSFVALVAVLIAVTL